MKRLSFFIAVFILFSFSSCEDAGTLEQVDRGNNKDIEVYRYYFDKGDYVYVARFKSCPNVVSTTWKQMQGKYTVTKGNVVIFENDSIKIELKTKENGN